MKLYNHCKLLNVFAFFMILKLRLCLVLRRKYCSIGRQAGHSRKRDDFEMSGGSVSSLPNGPNKDQIIVINMSGPHSASATRQRREMKLRNTFGWTRIDILTMLIVFIILASLSFSLVVEALQTLVHIDHQDTMHLPVTVMILGFVGLILNGLTYLLIGGYTMHQGSFLHVTPSGDVVLDRVLSTSGELEADERQLSKPDKANREIDRQLKNDLKADIGRIHYIPKRQGAVEMLRDVSSTIFVIVCALIVNMAEDEEHTAKFIDPVLSIFSCVLLVSLSYPYMKQSCLILLQTIPGSIDMEDFERTMVTQFPEIVSYHDLHIWQLSAHKSVATVHIMFENPQLYTKIIDDVRAFFHDRGITEITIQPEFQSPKSPSIECLMQCSALDCLDKVCCKDSRTDLREVISASPNGGSDTQLHKHSSTDDKAEPAKPVDVKYLDAKEIENNAEKPATPNMQEVTENKSESIEENVMAKNKAAEGTSGTDSSEHNLATTEEMHSTEEKSEKSTERKYMEVAMPNEMDKTS
ncbi:proton-coupled zinc antiporter SLC30A1 isoform X3 [Anastrepha obliqua]|uniref:proton-coupled zinc antiporter SLC30A1 isoform X3 n=1 Tax=Anastrepha obliqua TaxID=95512 RepID=UPI0024091A3D|nr:proton-coupled zinc antiporter SLC30A1 isoform X3 [Anastrepha obliqua]